MPRATVRMAATTSDRLASLSLIDCRRAGALRAHVPAHLRDRSRVVAIPSWLATTRRYPAALQHHVFALNTLASRQPSAISVSLLRILILFRPPLAGNLATHAFT